MSITTVVCSATTAVVACGAMSELKDRLKQLRGKDSQVVAARKCGMSQPMWSKLERGEVDSEDTSLLPKILEGYKPVRLEWLLRGEGPMLASAGVDKVVKLKPPHLASSYDPDALRNVEAIPTSRRLLPLLTEVQAGHPHEYIDDFAAGAADEYVEVDAELAKTLGPYSFALVVAGLRKKAW